jgi:MFS family permease
MTVASPPRPPALRRDAPSPTAKPHPPAPPIQPAAEDVGISRLPLISEPAEASCHEPAQPATASNIARTSPRSDLAYSTGDAASYSLMVGLGETYFSAFALAIGTGQTFAGLLATLPQLAGSLLQLAGPWGVKKLGSQRRWIVTFVSLQAASLLLLPLASYFSGGMAGLLVFLAVTLYWGSGLATGPVWNTWIEEIVPRNMRTNYFACRARVGQFCTLLGFIAGGVALQLGKANAWVLSAFCGIFLVASACRFVSAWCLSRQRDSRKGSLEERRVRIGHFFQKKHAKTAGEVGGRLVLYLLAVQMVVQISGPYFTPYMLKDLLGNDPLAYFNYVVLIGICFLGKVLAMPAWGRYAMAVGPKRLLLMGGIAIVPISGLWIFSGYFSSWQTTLPVNLYFARFDWVITGELLYLFAVQLLSGICWAAYELAMALMFFEAIPRQSRTSVLAIYNFGNALALVVGSLIGAAIMTALHESHAAYLTLFGLSSVLRLATLSLLLVPARKNGPESPQMVK